VKSFCFQDLKLNKAFIKSFCVKASTLLMAEALSRSAVSQCRACGWFRCECQKQQLIARRGRAKK